MHSVPPTQSSARKLWRPCEKMWMEGREEDQLKTLIMIRCELVIRFEWRTLVLKRSVISSSQEPSDKDQKAASNINVRHDRVLATSITLLPASSPVIPGLLLVLKWDRAWSAFGTQPRNPRIVNVFALLFVVFYWINSQINRKAHKRSQDDKNYAT